MSPRQRFLVRGVLVALVVAGMAAAFVVVGVVPPSAATWYPKCMSYQFTGLSCPGCGMTRAVHLALNGRPLEALSQNVLAVVVVPYLLVMLLRSLWHYLWQTRAAPPRFRWPRWWPYVLGGFLLLFTVARNIPVEPFSWLAPKELPAAEEGVPEPR